MKKIIIALSLAAIVLIGVVVYQRYVMMQQQQELIIEMYQFIKAGCPFSQLQ